MIGEEDSSGRGQLVLANDERKNPGASLATVGWLPVTVNRSLRLAGESAPDLILLDMSLPKFTRPRVLRSLRTAPQTARVPIVAHSSLPQSTERQLRRDGATAYFDKSKLGLHQHSESLIQIVKRILKKQTEENGNAELPQASISLPCPGKTKL